MKPILYAALGLVLATGCKKDDEEQPAGEPTETETEAEAKTPPEIETGDAPAAIEAVMGRYEECRIKLASDEADLSGCAAAVADAAEGKDELVPGDHMSKVAAKARELEKTPSEDIEEVRLAFGELSREIVDLLTAVPAAASEYHVFECSMAKGYNRWAQAGQTMANPYMGTRMLECGSEVTPGGDGTEGGGMDHEGMDHGDMKKKEG